MLFVIFAAEGRAWLPVADFSLSWVVGFFSGGKVGWSQGYFVGIAIYCKTNDAMNKSLLPAVIHAKKKKKRKKRFWRFGIEGDRRAGIGSL